MVGFAFYYTTRRKTKKCPMTNQRHCYAIAGDCTDNPQSFTNWPIVAELTLPPPGAMFVPAGASPSADTVDR